MLTFICNDPISKNWTMILIQNKEEELSKSDSICGGNGQIKFLIGKLADDSDIFLPFTFVTILRFPLRYRNYSYVK